MAVVAGTLNKYVFAYTVGSRTIFAANFEDAMVQLFNCSDGTNANGLDLNICGAAFAQAMQEGGPTTANTKVSNGAGRSGSLTTITLP